MNRILRFYPVIVLLFLSSLVFWACQKDISGNAPEGKQRVSVYLNDDPSFNFTKVLVDIRYVEIKVDTSHGCHDDDDHDGDDDDDDDDHHHDGFGQWDTLPVPGGVYDLLRLRNGIDTLLATGFVLNGRITKVRFTLGTNNSVWTDSVHSEPLSICEGRPYVYAKLKRNMIDTIPGGGIRVNIDFDVNKSIKRKNGRYCLKPELKAYSHHSCGEIEGKVLPQAANAVVVIYNNTDTATAIPFSNGKFKVRGLSPGIYSVLYDGTAPYQDTTITNVQVDRDREVHLPTITLHQ